MATSRKTKSYFQVLFGSVASPLRSLAPLRYPSFYLLARLAFLFAILTKSTKTRINYYLFLITYSLIIKSARFFLEVAEFHRERGAALRYGTERRGKAEHLRHWRFAVNHFAGLL